MKQRQERGDKPDFRNLGVKYSVSAATVEGWFKNLAVYGESWFTTPRGETGLITRIGNIEKRLAALEVECGIKFEDKA